MPGQAVHPRRPRPAPPGGLHTTLVAVRFDAELKAKYEALRAAGKPPEVALTAVMLKLLILANVLLRDGRTWTPKVA